MKKDPRDLHLGAIVKRLYLSGPVGGAGLRELLAHDESMDTDPLWLWWVDERRRATLTLGPESEWLRVARTACSPRGLGTSLD